MRKTLLTSLTSLLIPFAAYGANISYGAYQRRQSTYIGTHQPLPLANGQRHSFVERTLDLSAAELDISVGAAATELVIIDAAVPDKHILYRAAKPGVDIVEIASTEPGLAQLTGVLARYKNLSALHVVSHALHGELLLGNSRITAENIKHEIEAFAALNGALRDGGDLLFYGCDLAADEAGAELLEVIQGNTHLDLAASSDKTGAGNLQGDWELEIRRGDIETGLPFSDKALKDFSAVLAASNGTYGFQTGWSDAGNTLTHTHFVVGGRDANTTALLNVSIYNLSPFPAYIQTGHTSAYNYFYVLPDGVNTGSFELTGLTAGEYATGQFTNVRIVGVLRDDTQITSSTINGTGASEENFTFGAGQLANFAGVQLKAFKLYFDTTSDVGSTVPFFEFRTFTIANAQNPADNDGNLAAAGGVTEPVGLATTIDTVGEAANVFDFTISDGGTKDPYNLKVSELFINVSGTSTDAERGQITWRLNGPDASNVTGTYSAATDRITFSGLNIEVVNGGSETYTINAYYNNNTNITEGRTVILSIDGDTNLTVDPLGTQMGSTSAVNNGAGTTLDVVATQLAFTTQPGGSVSGAALTQQPVVAARDAFGNTDIHFTETITLTQASAGALSNNTQAASNGVATFTNLIYTATADQESFTLTASATGVTNDTANAVTSDVVATKLLFTTQPLPTNVANAVPTNFTTVPVVSAVDANDLVDTGYSIDITLTEVNGAGSAIMDADSDTDGNAATVSITPSSGVSTFTGMDITYTASGASNETFNLRASSGGLTTADSNQLTAITNNAPTDIVLSANDINQSSTGAAGAVGTLSTTDADGGDTHTYSLVTNGASGNGSCGAAGDDDNASFQIDNVNDELETAGSLSPGSYSVCIQTSDGAASYQETFSITVVDDVAPTVSSVSVPANATYIAGQNLDFTVNTNENVTVNTTGGTPQISLTIGATPRQAVYFSGSGTTALVFRYTVQVGDLDTDGIAVGTLSLNSGTLQDGAGNDLNTTLNSVGSTASVLVDAVAPTVSSVSVPADNTYIAGQNLDFTVNTNENITVNTTGGTPQISLTIGASTRQANYLSGSGTSALVFRYTAQAGDNDTDGIAVAASIGANGGTLRDGAGNDLNATLNSVGSTANVLVDTTAPSGHSVSFDDGTINGTEATSISFTFASAEVGADYSYTISSSGGGAPVNGNGTIAAAGQQISGIDVSGLNDGTLTLSVTLTDSAGNSAVAVTNTATLDASAPSGHSVSFDDGTINGTEATSISFTFASAEVGADYSYTISSSGGGAPVTDTGTIASAGEQISGVDISGLSDGTLTLSVTLTDSAGNSAGAVTDTATLDTGAPSGHTVSFDDDTINGAEATGISFTFASAEVGTNYSYTISSSGGGTPVTDTGTIATATDQISGIDVSGLNDGTLTLSVTLTDAAGNSAGAVTDTATLDASAPGGHSVSFDDGTINSTEATSIGFTFASAEVGADYSYTISSSGGGAPVAGTGTIATATDQISGIDVSGLNNGTLTLSVTLTDTAGNSAGAVTDTATLDAGAPTVSNVGVPANGSYSTGQNLDFTVNTNENVTVDTGGGTPQIALTIGSTTRQAVYLSGSGTSALVFRHTVQAGDLDTDGIAVAASIDANSGTLQDAAGNDMTLTLNSVGDTSAVLVDASAPVNNLPAAQITDAITQLVFSSGNGNAISIADDGSLTVVISIGSGTLTASTGGSAGISNNGTGTVTITGTAAEVNVALEGLTYTPNGSGVQTLNMLSTDGAGNTDDDDLEITVNAATLVVTSNLDTGDDETAAGSFAADQADGSGLSIREALNWARPGDTITFDLDSGTPGNQGGTIILNGNQLTIAYNNIRIDGDLNDDGSADVTISGNNASRVMSVNASLSGVELTGLTLTQGTGVGGAGLSLGINVSLTLRDSTVTNNTESGLGGGGIYGSTVTLTIINSTISNNSSDSFGGGIRAVGTSTMNLINSTVNGNTTTGASQHGGGIQYAGSTLTIINSTISGNAVTGANADGGGLRISTGTSYIYNTTIVGNAAANNGGGVSANGTSDTFINTVVAGNTAGAGATAAVGGSPLATGGAANDVSGTIETATNSFFGTTATITTDNSSLNNQGTGNLLLDNLGNYDGNPVQTHFPQTGSALLEAGSNVALPPDTFDLDGDSNTAEALPIDANGNPRVSNIVDIGAVEGDVPPAVTSVGVPANGTYIAGQNLDFTVNTDENITVDTAGGTPSIALTIGATTRQAVYLSGSGTSALVFRYTVQAGDNDVDGIAVAGDIDTNGGTLRNGADEDLATALNSVGSTASVLVDTVAPTVGSVSVPANGTYTAGQNLDFTVNYNENVTVNTGGGTPRLALTIGATSRFADYVSGSGSTALVFRYTVQPGDNDSDGIALSNTLQPNGGTLRDAVSNNADTNLGVIGSLAAVLVDARAPSVNSVTLPANSIYTAGQNLDFTVNYDEAVTVNTAGGTPRLALSIGATARFANYVSGSGGTALVFRYTVQAGDTDSDGIALSNTLQPNGGTLRDANGNDASTNLGAIGSLGAVLVDAQAPSVNSVTLPADGSYREGQNLNFTVNYDEVVTVNTAGGTPRLVLTIGVTTRYADYVSGSGGTTLLFRYTVQAGDNDSDGIALNTTLDVNGGTLRDTASNNAGTNLGAIGDLAAVLVDTQSPSITSVTLPANATYLLGQNIDFTVNYDENVTVTGTPRLALTIGATTRYATYNSGSGTNALLFRYTAQNGDSDGDGIELDTTLDVNGGTLRDAAGNDADTNLGVNDLSGVLVDALDTDGDGVSDVQEGIDGTDPSDPDDYLDNTAPVITPPADLVIDATGLYTPVTLRQLLGLAPAATDEEVQQAQAALATDNIDGADCCNTQAQGLENDRILLQPGQAQIVWQGSDRKGNNGQAVQNVNVRPLVSVGKDQTGVEGSPVIFRVILNGLSPVYPLDVPYTIDTAESSADNADHDLVDGVATFNAGETEVSITVNLLDDGVPEGDEVLVVRLDDPDINAGANITHRITITEGNVAPNVALNMQQNAVNVALVANNGGDVTVTANVTDPNAGDTHGYDWSGSDSQLTDTDGDVTDATFVFDPTLLTAGVHTVQVSVTDSGGATVTRLLHFSVVAEAPVLDPLDDTDGDGVDDVTEGIADSDGDGIPDYLDNITSGNVLPEITDITDAYLVECEPGVLCRLGSNALPVGGVQISTDDLPEDTLYTNIGGLFDFEIHDLPVAGQSTRVVIPQIAAIPADAAYRKFSGDQWFTFAEDANNALHSAQGEAGFCPPPGDASWEPGLVEGYLCVQVTIEDGGANDADGLANGSVEDPGGVGQPVAVNPPPPSGGSSWTISGSTKGGGGALGLPAGLVLLLLVLLRHRRRFAAVSALVATLLTPSVQAQVAEEDGQPFLKNGYLVLGLYQAEGDQTRGDFVSGMASDGVTVTVQEYEVSRTAYQLSLGYRYLPGMSVEFGYLDLGDVDFAFTANAADAGTLTRGLTQNLPISSDGWVLSNRFDYMLGQWRASADLGFYFWNGKALIDDPTIHVNIKDGIDPLVGLQLAYPLPGQFELALQYRRILFDDQNVELWGGALSWSF